MHVAWILSAKSVEIVSKDIIQAITYWESTEQ